MTAPAPSGGTATTPAGLLDTATDPAGLTTTYGYDLPAPRRTDRTGAPGDHRAHDATGLVRTTPTPPA